MGTEVAGLIGAERHERTGERTAYRKRTRLRTWDTRMGTIELAIPKVRPGTYFRRCCSQAGARRAHRKQAALSGCGCKNVIRFPPRDT
jgi:transposase-like protein